MGVHHQCKKEADTKLTIQMCPHIFIAEVFTGGDYTYPDHPVVTWDADKLGKAIFYHDRTLNEAFLSVVS